MTFRRPSNKGWAVIALLVSAALGACATAGRPASPSGVAGRAANVATLTATDLLGVWSNPPTAASGPGLPGAPVAEEQVLVFATIDSGHTFVHLKFNGPGMGVPHSFKYTVRGGVVRLTYKDGGSDTLSISSIDTTSFESTLVGKSTHLRGGTWGIGSWQPDTQ